MRKEKQLTNGVVIDGSGERYLEMKMDSVDGDNRFSSGIEFMNCAQGGLLEVGHKYIIT